MRSCQFKCVVFGVLLGLWSCSSKKTETEDRSMKNRKGQAKTYRESKYPSWLKVPERFSFRGEWGKFVHHNFFDELPSEKSAPNMVNAVILTPRDEETYFGLDLVSGAPYKRVSYCSFKDVTGNYGSSMKRPEFSLGIMPRVLDVLGRPLQIVVFGEPKEKFKSNSLHEVKVVGGVVENYCEVWPCGIARSWMSSIVLVAVYPEDKKFRDIESIFVLKKMVDWKEFKAFMINGRGVHIKSTSSFPAYKIKGEIGPGVALKKALELGHVFTAQEMFSMRTACHKLYDYVWNSVKILRGSKDENLSRWVRPFNKGASENVTKDFASYLYHFTEKYSNRYNTCLKYVRGTNINEDSERHWFFSYFDAFFLVKSLENIHICPENQWTKNFYNYKKGALEYDFLTELKQCKGKDLDYAFVRAINKLKNMGRQGLPSYKYLTYDHEAGGSHQKIYSWVSQTGLELNCKSKKEREIRSKKWVFGFPTDVSWQGFY